MTVLVGVVARPLPYIWRESGTKVALGVFKKLDQTSGALEAFDRRRNQGHSDPTCAWIDTLSVVSTQVIAR